MEISNEITIDNNLSFQNIIDKVPFSFTIIAVDGSILYINAKGLELFDLQPEDIPGQNVAELLWVDPSQREVWTKQLHDNGIVKNFEMHVQTKTGQKFWVMGSGLLVTYHNQTCVLATQHDITKRKLAEEALQTSEEKYRLLTEFTSDVIWVFNLTTGQFVFISPSITALRGFTVEEAMAERFDESLTPDSYVNVMDLISQHINEFLEDTQTQVHYIVEVQQPCKKGEIIWIEVSACFRCNAQSQVEIVGVSRNIEERKKAQEEVLYLLYHDYLTGLYNRRFYEEEMKRIDISENLPITLIMADVNGLKLTNDAFGHMVGDRLLQTVASALRQECRADDMLSRIGGDEFVILLPQTDMGEAEKIVARIGTAIEKIKEDSDIVSVSFGLATKREPSAEIADIYTQAEDQMYRRKLSESSSMKSEMMKLITKSLYEKDAAEKLHCERVSVLCRKIGKAMGLNVGDVDELGLAGLLHDIGKIGINKPLLHKDGVPDELEWTEIRRHPEIGYQILRSVSEFSHIAEYILAHHERVDGKGYPRGLKADAIPLQAKILAVAGCYDAMISGRSYKKAMNGTLAVEELKANVGTQFDKNVVDAFIAKVI